MKKNAALLPYLSVFWGALLLLAPAFTNNFPFLYSDTCTYLDGGFGNQVNNMRPITYGLFLRHVSLLESLWLVVWVQALIVSWLIHLFFAVFSEKKRLFGPLACITMLSLCTQVGVNVGMLMPDFFTAAILLSAAVLSWAHAVSRWSLVGCGLIFWLGCASHHSHLFIFTIVMGGTVLWGVYARYRRWTEPLPRRLLLTSGLLALAWLTIPTLHYAYGGKFERENASHVFIVGRMSQMGILQPFLRERCGTDVEYNLCPYRDRLPSNFLWDPNGPVYQTGGWQANREEYRRLIWDVLTTPRYAWKFSVKTLENSVQQFFCYEGRIVFKEVDGGAPIDALNRWWPEQMPMARLSLQYQNAWPYQATDVLQRFMVMGSFLWCIWCLCFAVGATSVQRRLAAFLLLGLCANALICAGVSMIDPRFQSRVIWLVPMFALWLAGERWRREGFDAVVARP